MKHDSATEFLHHYLDGELDTPLVEELERHVQQCVTCRGELEGLRQLLAGAAALPRTIEPARDLWPAIAKETVRHDPAVESTGSRILRRLGFFSWSWPTALASAAVVGVLCISSFNTEQLLGPVKGISPAGVSSLEGADPQAAALVHALEAECRECDRELDAYARVAPESSIVTRMLKESMPVVDKAIAEARAAWLSSPNEPGLARFLTSAYRAKMALQGRAIRMVSAS
jgi:hypothetical protein